MSKDKLKVMVGSAGRRVYLLDYFREAANALDVDLELHITENDPHAATTFRADKVHLLPRFDSETYTDQWLNTVKAVQPDLYFSVNDYEISYLSNRAPLDQLPTGTLLPHLKADAFEITFDKYRLWQALSAAGIGTVPTALASHAHDFVSTHQAERYVVKDRFGSGSSGLAFLAADEVPKYLNSVTDPTQLVIQVPASGEEFGMDLVASLKGRGEFRAALVRRKLGMHSGETDKAVTVDPTDFSATAEQLATTLQAQGLIDTDVFMTEDGPLVIDINPRFGGGYPFAHVAGANVPLSYLREILNLPQEPSDYVYEAGILAAKYPQLAVGSVS